MNHTTPMYKRRALMKLLHDHPGNSAYRSAAFAAR